MNRPAWHVFSYQTDRFFLAGPLIKHASDADTDPIGELIIDWRAGAGLLRFDDQLGNSLHASLEQRRDILQPHQIAGRVSRAITPRHEGEHQRIPPVITELEFSGSADRGGEELKVTVKVGKKITVTISMGGRTIRATCDATSLRIT